MCPEFMSLGNFVIYWYGVMVAIGVLVGSLIFQKIARQNGYPETLASNIVFWSVIWGIIGGRTLHIIVQFPYYYRNPYEIISLRNGGLAAEGAVISVILFIYLYSKIRRFNFRKTLDMISIPAPLTQAIGRIGCFLNGCCYGKPSHVPWAVKFPYLETKVHPTQLYYVICHICLFILLINLYRRKLKEGMLFSTYLMCFAFIRYSIDNLRGDLLTNYFGLYTTQVIAIILFVAGIIWFISSIKQHEVTRSPDTSSVTSCKNSNPAVVEENIEK